jgi:hypothetical protein
MAHLVELSEQIRCFLAALKVCKDVSQVQVSLGEIRLMSAGAGLGYPLVDGDGFLDGRQGALPPAQFGQPDA